MVRRLFPLLDVFRRSSCVRGDCCEVVHTTARILRSEHRTGDSRMVFDVVLDSSGGSSKLLSIRPPRGSAALPARARMARVALAATLVAAIMTIIAGPARADLLAVGPVDPATQVPAWFQDKTGLQLGLCLDGPPLCLTTAADFDQLDGEGFYWRGGADLTSGALKAKLVLAEEATNPAGGRAAFMRVRAVITGGHPSTAYAVTHPFGSGTITTNAVGVGRISVDTGCTIGPCPSFAGALTGAIGPFLRWDPTLAPAAPAGYVGDSVTPHRVTGSPTNRNVFSVSGGGVALTTNEFTIAGKLAGPPVPVYNGPGTLDFGAQPNGAAAPVQTATIASFGVPDAGGRSNLGVSGVTLSGPAAADYQIVSNTCGGPMPSGASCAVGVRFVPSAAGARTASLDVATNAASGLDHVVLSGAGIAPAAAGRVAAAGARSRLAVRKLRTTHRMTRARVLRSGLRLSMRLPQGTEIVKISVLRVRHGKVNSNPVWLGFRVAPSRLGLYRIRLDSRALRHRLTAGLYQVNVTPGLSKHELGQTSTTRIRITRR
jgi:hypothetical protein